MTDEAAGPLRISVFGLVAGAVALTGLVIGFWVLIPGGGLAARP